MEPRTNFYGLCFSGFLAKASYALARTPVRALFAASFGVGPEAIAFAVAISTITGVFFKMPAGVISDIIGRPRTMLIGLSEGRDFRLAFACIAAILVVSALLIRRTIPAS